MNLRTLLALALTVPALTAPAALAADGVFDRTLTFSGAPTVSISTGAGYLHVAPGPDNQFHVTGQLLHEAIRTHGTSVEKIRAALAHHEVNLT